MNINNMKCRQKERFNLNNIQVGLIKSRSFFIKKPERISFWLLDISGHGFKTLCALQVQKDELYDFSFDLPIYGTVKGRGRVMWKKKLENNTGIQIVGFKFEKFKRKCEKIVHEITSSELLVTKLNEMRTNNNFNVLENRWDI